ncbi:PilZ domain-containing protein [Azoarcus sp. PA01]|nr:PilZ domain-containing protein [Azoarcus sp. PA01]
MRRFIRHPVSIPIEVRAGEHAGGELHPAGNVSLGGIEFDSDSAIEPGSLVEVRIPIIEPTFATCGRVAWCRRTGNRFELGVQFLDADEAYRTRMVEQVCHIEEYRRSVQRLEGRELSAEEAAFEWIGRFAGQFPEAGDESS